MSIPAVKPLTGTVSIPYIQLQAAVADMLVPCFKQIAALEKRVAALEQRLAEFEAVPKFAHLIDYATPPDTPFTVSAPVNVYNHLGFDRWYVLPAGPKRGELRPAEILGPGTAPGRATVRVALAGDEGYDAVYFRATDAPYSASKEPGTWSLGLDVKYEPRWPGASGG